MPASHAVTGVVPYLHVASVSNSMTFYQLLGMTVEKQMGPDGEPFWASLSAGEQSLMLASASGPIDAGVQAVLLYLYAPDLESLRAHLLDGGLANLGSYCGQPYEPSPKGGVFEVRHPDYMPNGELRVHDPDGYVLLVGQLEHRPA